MNPLILGILIWLGALLLLSVVIEVASRWRERKRRREAALRTFEEECLGRVGVQFVDLSRSVWGPRWWSDDADR